MKKTEDAKWREIHSGRGRPPRQSVSTNRMILWFGIILLTISVIGIAYKGFQRGKKLDRIEKKIETLIELRFLDNADRRGLPVDSLIVEGELKAIYHLTERKE